MIPTSKTYHSTIYRFTNRGNHFFVTASELGLTKEDQLTEECTSLWLLPSSIWRRKINLGEKRAKIEGSCLKISMLQKTYPSITYRFTKWTFCHKMVNYFSKHQVFGQNSTFFFLAELTKITEIINRKD